MRGGCLKRARWQKNDLPIDTTSCRPGVRPELIKRRMEATQYFRKEISVSPQANQAPSLSAAVVRANPVFGTRFHKKEQERISRKTGKISSSNVNPRSSPSRGENGTQKVRRVRRRLTRDHPSQSSAVYVSCKRELRALCSSNSLPLLNRKKLQLQIPQSKNQAIQQTAPFVRNCKHKPRSQNMPIRP
jgi:hypothetical protein